MAKSARQWLDLIHALPLSGPVRIMNVCGGHERSIAMAGLRGVLPEAVELIPGPGCPVCICPEEDLYQAIRLALDEDVVLAAFGDMLRVPINAPRREVRTLVQAQAAGADVRPLGSPMEALAIARASPEQQVVFFATGFETTIAPVAAMLVEGIPDNLLVLLSGRLTWPAVAMLLESGTPGFDALIAPGHVATIMGAHEWRFVVDQHGLPAAVAGFGTTSLLAAFYSVLRQHLEGEAFLDNCYPELVRPQGNPTARAHLGQVMRVMDARWRGIGTIPDSGFELRSSFARHDARSHFKLSIDDSRRGAGQMPQGCDCAKVILGQIYPDQCRIFGRACTPRQPVGPCMVSDEGACRIWWAAGKRHSRAPESGTSQAN